MNLLFKNYSLLTIQEQKELLKVRNLEYIRQQMKSPNIISLDSHLKWIENLESNQNSLYYAVIYNDKIIGGLSLVDIEYKKTYGNFGVFFIKQTSAFISSVATYLVLDRIFNLFEIKLINSEVKKTNSEAYKFNKSFGFIQDKQNSNDDFYHLSLDFDKWNNTSKLIKTIKKVAEKTQYTFLEGDILWMQK